MGRRRCGRGQTTTSGGVHRDTLGEALAAGAVGFGHLAPAEPRRRRGRPMPSRLADDEELKALRSVQPRSSNLADQRSPQGLRTRAIGGADELIAEVDDLRAGRRSSASALTWTPCTPSPPATSPGGDPWTSAPGRDRGVSGSRRRSGRRWSRRVRARRAQPSAQPGAGRRRAPRRLPRSATVTAAGAAGHAVGAGGVVRGAFATLQGSPPDLRQWRVQLSPTRRTCAASRWPSGIQLEDLVALAVDDELATSIAIATTNDDEESLRSVLMDDRTLVAGLGDSGAHVTSIANYSYPTHLLAHFVHDGASSPSSRRCTASRRIRRRCSAWRTGACSPRAGGGHHRALARRPRPHPQELRNDLQTVLLACTRARWGTAASTP